MPDDEDEALCANAGVCLAWRRSAKELDKQVRAHARALFGYVDDEAVAFIPGLLQNVADMKRDMAEMSEKLEGVPETVALGKAIKQRGTWAFGGIFLLLIALVSHQYGLLNLLKEWHP